MINSAPRFAVVLSGCGVFDGSEIHEAVLTMLAIDEAGGEYRCFAPNTWQAKCFSGRLRGGYELEQFCRKRSGLRN